MNYGVLLVAVLFVAFGFWSARGLVLGLKKGVMTFPKPGKPIRRSKQPKAFAFAVYSHAAGSVFLVLVGVVIAYFAVEGVV